MYGNDKTDQLRQIDIEATRKKLARDKQEAEIQRIEVEIAREKAEGEKQLTQIRNQAELEYRLQREENTAAIAQAQLKNIESFGLETLAAIDPAYQAHIDSRQAQMDLERENTKKDIELARQKLSMIKEIKEIQ